MLFSKRKSKSEGFDRENQIPVLHCSICTGEQVAGFKDKHTGKFEDVCLIRNEKDLQDFKNRFGIAGEITKEY